MTTTRTATNPRLQAALYLADLGYPVFPCRPSSKKPATDHGFLDATTDHDKIEAWWAENPDYNVAIATQSLFVLDVDPKGKAWLAMQDDRELTRGPHATTPRKGQHFYFAQNGVELRNTESKIAPGVDTRANGGYVLVAPSVVNGKSYQWVAELDCPPERLPGVPSWLVEAQRGKPREPMTATAGGTSAQIGPTIPEGQRNGTLIRFAGGMRRMGLSAGEIKAALEGINAARCRPPLPSNEVEGIAKSAARWEPDKATVGNIQQAVSQVEYERMTAAELATGDFAPTWFVEDIAVDQQPGIISGRFKTLKTTVLMALALSLATARKFLGRFWVPRPVNVGVFSGESGKGTLQETGLRVAKSIGVNLATVDRLIVSTTLPKIGRLDHYRALERYILDNELQVVFIDPSYLAMPAVADKAGNVFAVGALLAELNELTQATGCGFWLCNHNKRARSFDVPELGDVAWSGFAEWARQWLLLGKRREWDAETGRHWLWMVAGGSAGHGAVYGLNVLEGKLCDPDGRRWEVEVLAAGEARDVDRDSVETQRTADSDRRFAAAVAAAREAIDKALVTAPDNADTKTGIRDRCGHKGKAFDQALATMLRQGELVDCDIERNNGQRYRGYRRVYQDAKPNG